MGGLVFRPRLIRRCARIRAVSAAYVRKFYWKLLQKKALAGASGAERTARENKGADHRLRARQWPGYVRRGTGGASNCTNGPNYGPATAKSAQMDLARGFARWLLRDDPDRDHGISSARLSIQMVALVGASEGKWAWRSELHQKTGLVRASTWGWSWKWQARTPARLCSL